MNRFVSVRVGVVFASVVMAAAGCTCPGPGPGTCDNSDLTATFVTPTDGAMVEQTSNVQVSLSRRGNPVNVGVGRLEIRGPGASEFGASRSGTVDGANVTFAGVMLAAGENALRATVSEVDCAGNAAPVTIVVTARTTVTPPPVVLGCDFPQDANNDGTLNAAELPAGQAVSVRVRTQNGSGATFSAPNSTPASAAIMNETATVTVPGPTADGTFAVVGTVTRGAAMPTCTASIRVQRMAGCSIENTTDESPRGPMNDADPMTAGYQVRATASRVAGMAATARLQLGTETRTINLDSMATASADFTIPTSGTQSYAVTLTGSDAAGNPCTVVNGTRNVPADFDPPVVTIASPTQVDGGVLLTQSPVPVIVNVGMEDNGATACAFVGTTQVGCGLVSNGTATLQIPFGSDGVRTIEVRVTDVAGNTGTGSVVVNVALSGCGVVFYSPATNPALLNATAAAGGNYTFRTSSKAICAGQPARLSRAVVTPDAGVGAFSPVGAATLTVRGLSDGGSDAVAAFVAAVANGDYAYRAEVDNVGDGGVDATQIAVTVDLDGPAITTPVVPGGQTRALINIAQDSSATIPGAQRTLAFNARVPMGGRVDVCTTQNTGTPTPECGSGWFRLATNQVSPVSGFTFPEGTYDLKVVVIGGGAVVESPPLPVFVDVTRPCVAPGSLRLPQDTNMDGRLNAAELGAAPPQLDFRLDPTCGDANLATLSALAPVLVREVVAGVVSTTALNQLGDVSFDAPSGRVRVNLTQGVSAEADYEFFVELQDSASNRNFYTTGSNNAVLQARVDRVAPSCTLISPAQLTLNLALVPGGALGVTLATAADVRTNGVSITLQGLPTQSATPGGGNQATVTFSGLSGTNTRTLDASCTDQSGNSTALVQRTLLIDLDAPTCQFTAPTMGATLPDLSVTTTLTVAGAEGRTVTIASTIGGVRGTLSVSGGTATGSITYANGGPQDFSASLTDTAGNPGTCAVTGITINSSDCGLAISNAFMNTNGLWFNRSNTGSLTTTTGVATVNAVTSGCTTGRTLTLVRTAPTAGTPINLVDTGGMAAFANVAFADGESWSLSVPNGARPATVLTFRVDLDAPSFGVAPAQLGFARINGTLTAPAGNTFFVAAANNRNVETSVSGYFADLSGATAGAQADLVLDGVEAFDFATNGSVAVLFKGMPLATQSVSASTQTISFTGGGGITLPHNDSGAFVVRVTDAAGNSSEWTSTATIDVMSPAEPQAATATIPTQADGGTLNHRRGLVSVAWDPSFDDGATAASGPCQYEIGWTTSSVPGNGGLATPALYFGNSANREPRVAHSMTRTTEVVKLPPLNTYFIKVRAIDEVGNYSAFGGAPLTTSNMWTQVTIQNPSADTTASVHNFGQNFAGAGSLNSDSIPDLVIAAPNRGPTGSTNRGSVYIYYGAAGFTAPATCGTAGVCQELQPPTDTTASGLFGTDLSTAGNVGDVGAENKADLLVSQPTWQTNVGRAFLWFGANAAEVNATSFIEFRGLGTGSNFASTTRIIQDVDGDGLDEVAISAHSELANVGRVYVFRGRSADPSFNSGTIGANWFNSRTGVDGATLFIPASAATWILEGPNPAFGGNNDFGRLRHGLVSMGRLDSSMTNNNHLKSFFIIPMSRETVNRVQLFSGPALSGVTGTVLNSSGPMVQTIRVTAPGMAVTQLQGFGRSSVGGIDFAPGSGPDLLLGYPLQSRIYLVENFGPTGIAGGATPPEPSPAITGLLANQLGFHVSAADTNDDGRADILSGESRASGGQAWVIWQRMGGFDNVVDGVTPRLWISGLGEASSTSRLGRMTGLVDIDGNGYPDVTLGDETGVGTPSGGRVHVWR